MNRIASLDRGLEVAANRVVSVVAGRRGGGGGRGHREVGFPLSKNQENCLYLQQNLVPDE